MIARRDAQIISAGAAPAGATSSPRTPRTPHAPGRDHDKKHDDGRDQGYGKGHEEHGQGYGKGHEEHGQGYGLGHEEQQAPAPERPHFRGESDKCAFVARLTGLSVEEVQAMRESGRGWSNIAREIKATRIEARREGRHETATHHAEVRGERLGRPHFPRNANPRIENVSAKAAFAAKAKDAMRRQSIRQRRDHD